MTDDDVRVAGSTPLMAVEHLTVSFAVRAGVAGSSASKLRAVDDVTLQIYAGETLGLVGESGCGKTTLARALLRLNEASGGVIRFDNEDITTARNRALGTFRRNVQMVFQDPQSSLNPYRRVSQIVGAGAKLRGARGKKVSTLVAELLRRVGLSAQDAQRYPHEFSGGQRQRIGIARALAADPRLVILDEPVSALDVSVQAQIVNLLGDLQRDLGLAYVFVAHDLAVVRHVSDRIAVMYLGKIVELAAADALYAAPKHPYTANLLKAVPIPNPEVHADRRRLVGELPSPTNPPPGCRFNPRCWRATEICSQVEPPLADLGDGHLAACHHPLNASNQDMEAAVRSEASPLGSGTELTLSSPASIRQS